MTPLVAEWLHKAEADASGAEVLLKSRRREINDLICFHCQQAVEKYIKARLQEADARFPKTHDLSQLIALVIPHDPLWGVLCDSLRDLDSYAVETRYPGRSASRQAAREAMRIMRRVQRMAKDHFGALGVVAKPKGGKGR